MIGLLHAASATHQGQRRDHNEDYTRSWEPETEADEAKHGWIYIVADGVGGADAGEVASQYATDQTLKHYFENSDKADWAKRIVDAMQTANTDLRQLVAVRNNNRRMATTMVTAVIRDDHIYMANVGDSRGYRWRDGEFQQITKDQSLVARLLEEGAITAEEAENHPRKNVILSSVGSERRAQIDMFQISFQPADILVLCSDGLTRHVKDDEMAEIITEQDPDTAVTTLINLANDRGGEDNISVTIVRYQAATDQNTAVSHKTLAETQPMPTRPLADSQPLAETRPLVPASDNAANISNPKLLWQYTLLLTIIQTFLILYFYIITRP